MMTRRVSTLPCSASQAPAGRQGMMMATTSSPSSSSSSVLGGSGRRRRLRLSLMLSLMLLSGRGVTGQGTFQFTPAPVPPAAPAFAFPTTPTAPARLGPTMPNVVPTNFGVPPSSSVAPVMPPPVVVQRPPTLSPVDVVVTAPSRSPTPRPTTLLPTTLLPTTLPPTFPPPVTARPVVAPPVTARPVMAPPVTAQPVLVPVTARPSTRPTTVPSRGIVLPNITTAVPTTAVNNNTTNATTTTLTPTSAAAVSTTAVPTTTTINPRWTTRNENVQHVTLTYQGLATQLDFDAEEDYSEYFTRWFDAYFNNNNGGDNNNNNNNNMAQRRRSLQGGNGGRSSVRNMASTVDFSKQLITTTSGGNMDNGPSSNTITYTHSLVYEATLDAPPAMELVALPFRDATYRSALTELLRDRVPGFAVSDGWDGQVGIPTIVLPPGPDNPVKPDTIFSPAVITGISAAGILTLLGLCLGCYCLFQSSKKSRDRRQRYGKPERANGSSSDHLEQHPPDQFQFSHDNNSSLDDGISVMMMEDNAVLSTTKTTRLSADGSTLGYGDQSVATVDYDYSKAYGGGGAASVVSSVGGTLGDTLGDSKLNGGDTLGATSRRTAALGANVVSSPPLEAPVRPVGGGVHEEVIVIEAPPGKLGVVIDTPDDGAPLVHAVKDSSVIANQICVGDKLVAVDDDDVRALTAIKVSKLISKRSNNPTRRLTVVRTIHTGSP